MKLINKNLFRYTFSRFSDPFKLPFDPSLSSKNQSEDLNPEFFPQPINRHNENEFTKRQRLVYQSRKRGTLECDILLSTFAKDNLKKMNYGQLVEYDELLNEPDWDIYYWCLDKKQPPVKWQNNQLLNNLKLHVKNNDKLVRRMPNLQDY